MTLTGKAPLIVLVKVNTSPVKLPAVNLPVYMKFRETVCEVHQAIEADAVKGDSPK